MMIVNIFIFFCIFVSFSFFTCSEAEDFSHFKSYRNAEKKPARYSKVATKHAIEEYLSPSQKEMMKHRKSKHIMKKHRFTDKWSGFDKPIGDGDRKLVDTDTATDIDTDSTLSGLSQAMDSFSLGLYFLLILVTLPILILYILPSRYKQPVVSNEPLLIV